MSIRAHTLANYFGQGWVALMSIAFVPVYIDRLGIEAYGLIGIYTVLQTWLSILDLGITPTITREIAKLKSGEHSPESIRNLIFSFETITYLLAAIILITLWFCAPYIASHWLNSSQYSKLTISNVIQVTAFVIATRFCEGIYRGSLIGLEKHITINQVQFVSSTLKFGGAAVIVSYHPSIITFFEWQAIISFITVIFLRVKANSTLNLKSENAKFSFKELKKVKGFASGMTLTTALALVFNQADKVFVSKFDSLENFGSYMLAFTISGILPMLIYPIVSTISPKLNSAVSLKNKNDEVFLFSSGTQIVSIISTSIFTTCCFCSNHIIAAWTNNFELSSTVGPLLSWVIVGAYCNSLLLIPFALQQAHGWTTLSVKVNLTGAVLLVPSVYLSLQYFGTIGAAVSWAVSNILIFILATIKMHKKLLKEHLSFFIIDAAIKPLAIGYIISTFTNTLLNSMEINRIQTALILVINLALIAAIIAYVLPIRKNILAVIKKS